jgi:hypothetical protein
VYLDDAYSPTHMHNGFVNQYYNQTPTNYQNYNNFPPKSNYYQQISIPGIEDTGEYQINESTNEYVPTPKDVTSSKWNGSVS